MPQFAIAALAKVFIYYGVQAAVAKFAATIFVYAASAYLLNRMSKSMTPKARNNAAVSGATVNYFNTTASIRIAYGRVRSGGMETIPPIVGAADNKLLHKVVTLAGHEVDSFNVTMFDTNTIPNNILRAMAYTSSDGEVTTGPYSGHAFIRQYRGTTTDSADKILVDYSSAVFANFRGRSFAKVAISLVYDEGVYKNVPDITFTYQGKRCYDPRLDVSPGASPTNASYTRWGFNPALALTDYLMSDFGGDYEADDIDWDTVVTAANTCAELVPVAFPYTTFTNTAGMTQSGFTFTKTSGVSAWDSGFRSTDGWTGNTKIVITWRANQTNRSIMVGVNQNPTFDDSYTSIDACIYMTNAGMIQIYESNNLRGTFGSYTTETVFEMHIESTKVTYIIDGLAIYGSDIGFATRYMDSSFFDVGGSVTLGMNRRYTCNGVLLATDKFEENVKVLANSMLGRIIFRDGKWRIYAGGWRTPSFTIQKADWISNVSVKFEQGKAKRFNRMRCFFIDPEREWQQSECYPRTNSTYVTADKGEVIDAEFEDFLCTDENEAQRKAEFLLRQSRNQIAIAGRLPPRFQDIALWDTGTIVMEGFGWISKTFRAVSLDINPDGTVDGVFSEEQSSDWTDMTEGEYDKPSRIPLPATNVTTPSAPVSFSAARQLNGSILFDWARSVVFPAGSRYEIIRSTTTLATVSTTIWEGTAHPVPLVCPTSPHWYFARARTPQNVLSDYSPNTFGLGVTARLEADQTLQQRLVGDAEFEYGESTSHWWAAPLLNSALSFFNQDDERILETQVIVVDTLNVSSVITTSYHATGGQYGGYMNMRVNNVNSGLPAIVSANPLQPFGTAYGGEAFGVEYTARIRPNSFGAQAGRQMIFGMLTTFSTPNSPTMALATGLFVVGSRASLKLGEWTTIKAYGVTAPPVVPTAVGCSVSAAITSASGFYVRPFISIGQPQSGGNWDVDYFQAENIGLRNDPVQAISIQVLADQTYRLYEFMSMFVIMPNGVGATPSFILPSSSNFKWADWRQMQIGRRWNISKTNVAKEYFILPSSGMTLRLAGRAATGTIVFVTSLAGRAVLEKTGATEFTVWPSGVGALV